MHLRSREKFLPFVCIERDEVKGPDCIKQASESWRPTRPLFFELGPHTAFVQLRTRTNAFARFDVSARASTERGGYRSASTERGAYNGNRPTRGLSESLGFNLLGNSST